MLGLVPIVARKCCAEFKDKAVRLVKELVELEGYSQWAAAERIDKMSGVSAHMLNRWLKPRISATGAQDGTGESVDGELKRLPRENKEVRCGTRPSRLCLAYRRRMMTSHIRIFR